MLPNPPAEMEHLSEKDNRTAIIGTIVFHAILLFALLYFGLRTPLPLPEEEGVIVALGIVDVGTGQIAPNRGAPVAVPPAAPSATRGQDEVVTQDTEESIAIPPPTRRPRPQPQEQPRQQPTTQPAPAPQPTPEPPRQQVDQRALFPGADQRGTTTPTQGTGTQPGVQGRPTGTPEGAGTGAGQSGVSFDLAGRSPSSLPLPIYDVPAQGRVVVTITVDRQGRVVRAVAGARGTTTTDATLHRLAETAALRARFNANPEATEEQVGTITYLFIRQN